MNGPEIPYNGDLEFFRQCGTKEPMKFFSISQKLAQVTKCMIDRRRQIGEQANVHCISIDIQLSDGETPPITMVVKMEKGDTLDRDLEGKIGRM